MTDRKPGGDLSPADTKAWGAAVERSSRETAIIKRNARLFARVPRSERSRLLIGLRNGWPLGLILLSLHDRGEIDLGCARHRPA